LDGEALARHVIELADGVVIAGFAAGLLEVVLEDFGGVTLVEADVADTGEESVAAFAVGVLVGGEEGGAEEDLGAVDNDGVSAAGADAAVAGERGDGLATVGADGPSAVVAVSADRGTTEIKDRG
jgi:hypothetical protein